MERVRRLVSHMSCARPENGLLSGAVAGMKRSARTMRRGRGASRPHHENNRAETRVTDESFLLQSLAADPVGDTARLVYADWLDEHDRPVEAALQRVLGEPGSDVRRLEYAEACERRNMSGDAARAEFVRVQVERSRTTDADHASGRPCKDRACRACYLRRRERELLPVNGRHARAWFDGPWWESEPGGGSALIGSIVYPGMAGAHEPQSRIRHRFVRGFVESVTCSAADWVAHGDTIRARQPVRLVVLTSLPDSRWMVGGASEPQVKLRDRERWHRWTEIRLGNAAPVECLLRAEWPGVVFEVPSGNAAEPEGDRRTNPGYAIGGALHPR